MQRFRGLMTRAFDFTDQVSELHPRSRKTIEQKIGLDFGAEEFLFGLWHPHMLWGGSPFCVATKRRIITNFVGLQQNYFKDLTGVERSLRGDVVVLSPGNKTGLFGESPMIHPPGKLKDHVFLLLSKELDSLKG